MSSEQARPGDTIFQAALDLPAGERAAYLDTACAGDMALRREVESLIAAYERAGSFIERPAIEADAAVVAGQQTGSLVGKSVQHYRVVRLLGAGGMGEVYLATDTKLDRPIALKLLPAEIARDHQRLQRFLQEARAAAALSHPNIAHIYEIGEANGAYFIAMEYVEGMPLDQRIAAPPLSIAESLDLAMQITDALDEAHSKGITHRDIKPSNIIITPRGRAKVLDFGLAKLSTPPGVSGRVSDSEVATRVKTSPGIIMGTVNYMSPEQASGEAVDARTDIWSLGVVIYEMVTGHVPFTGPTPSHTVVAILEKEPLRLSAYVSNVPEALEWIVSETLTKDREERTQSAHELLKKLQRVKQRIDTDAEVERSVALEHFSTSSDTAGTRSMAASTGEVTETPTNVSSAEYVVNQIKRHKGGVALAAALVAVALAGLAFGLYKFFSRTQSASTGILKVTPLTSSPYIERNVAFSPDGRQVAYVWTGEKNMDFDLYVKIIGAGEPLRLTNGQGRVMSPAWSPDGRYIAFLRGTGEGKGFYLIPALGGAERKLADVYGLTGLSAGVTPMPQAVDWSPDGKTLAVVDKTSENEPWSIFLISVETGERRRLTQPPAGYTGDIFVSFSPDGSRLALARLHGFTGGSVVAPPGDIYTVSVAGGEPVRITSDEAGVYGVAWTADGAELVFSSNRGGGDPVLWRVPAAGGTPTLIAGVGQNVWELAITRQGDRLAYAQMSADLNIYRLELTGQPGGRRGAGAPASFISSTRLEGSPQFSPDGHRVAFFSDRSGSSEIWVCDAEGKNLVQLTNFGGPRTDTPSWSPDGRLIAFTSFPGGNGDIYVVSADGGSPRRLTSDPSAEGGARWSRDGRWIYFTSNRTGRNEVWKMPAAGGAAIQLTRGGGRNPVESPDGRTVYYRGESGLRQVSTEGGEETQVSGVPVGLGNWAVVERGIYLLNRQPGHPQYALEFFDFATRQTTQITTLEGPRGVFTIYGLTVSPDEHSVLYAQRDKLDFDLMLVENFH
jgi:Tol biopolymer transport system component/predicted Ser/Thr protein kinase